ncbi:hypothetical protein M8J75_008957 [Diaphorina citri]|nr:hypothetical protein M8J75_008957 [Diaphorina citri]
MPSIKFQTSFISSFQPPPEVTVSKIYLTDRSKTNSNNNYFHCHKEVPRRDNRNQLVKEESIESTQSSESASLLQSQRSQRYGKKKKNRKKKKISESTDNLLKESTGRTLGAQVQPLMSILMSPRKQYSAFNNNEDSSNLDDGTQNKYQNQIRIRLIELPASVEAYQTKAMSKTLNCAWLRSRPLKNRKNFNTQPFFIACSSVSLSPRLQTCDQF